MKIFYRYVFVVAMLLVSARAGAQADKMAAKVYKSVVSVITYSKASLLKTGTAFVAADGGVCVADYNLFLNADSAVVTDAAGKSYAVDYILGADDTYRLVKFHSTSAKLAPMPLSRAKLSVGSQCCAVAYGGKKPETMVARVTDVTNVNDSCLYYQVDTEISERFVGAPVLNGSGMLVGIVQQSVGGKGYILDVSYLNNVNIKAISSKSENYTLQRINIMKGLPDNLSEALVYLYMKSKNTSNSEYLSLLNMFVKEYPDNQEGYLRRATPLMDLHRFDEANADLNKYLQLSKDKANAKYNICQVVRTKLVYQPEPAYSKWNFNYLLSLIDEAIAEDPKFDYKVEKAQTYMSMKDFNKAFDYYGIINESADRCPASLYAQSLAAEARGDSLTDVIAIMDSAVVMMGEPMPSEAASYILRRGQLYNRAGQYRKAVNDYNQFCYLSNNKVNAQFYYDRALIEINAHLYQQALDDLEAAISDRPSEPLYYIEKAALQLRVNLIDDCIATSEKCISLFPGQYPDIYRILGYAQVQKGDKQKGLVNLNKAIELGDEYAKEIIDNYVK